MAIPRYRQLKGWQKAHEVAINALKLVDNLPDRPGISRIMDHLIGSSTSVGANIAEGSSSRKGREYIRYLEIALRSTTETVNWLQILKDAWAIHQHIDDNLLEEIENGDIETIRMLVRMISRLEKKRDLEGKENHSLYEEAEDYS